MRAQGLRGHDFDPPLERLLQEKGKLHEMVEGLSPRLELHEQIDIAARSLLSPNERPKKPDPPYAQGPDLGLVLADELEDVFLRPDTGLHVVTFAEYTSRVASHRP